jgi:uncharacterized membrane protein
MDWVLLFVRDLNFAIWLGGLIAIDCIEAPARFRTPELDRNQIVAVGRQVFAAFNRAEIVMGATLMLVSLLLLLRADDARFLDRVSGWMTIGCLGLMALIALVQFLKLRPRMVEISRSLDLVNRDESDPRYAEMRRLHRAYIALDIAKIAMGMVALGFWSVARSS